MCVCDSTTPLKALRVGFNGSRLIYYSKNSLAPELLINRPTTTTAATTLLLLLLLLDQSLQSYTTATGGRRRRRKRTMGGWGITEDRKRRWWSREESTNEWTLQSRSSISLSFIDAAQNNTLPPPPPLSSIRACPFLIHRLHLHCPSTLLLLLQPSLLPLL